MTQIKSIQNLTSIEPPQSQVTTFLTPEIINEHIAQYDTGIREVQQAFNNYIQNNPSDTYVFFLVFLKPRTYVVFLC